MNPYNLYLGLLKFILSSFINSLMSFSIMGFAGSECIVEVPKTILLY